MGKSTESSLLERTNLEVHVEMERQRFSILSEKVETIDERLDALILELSEFRKEHSHNMQTLRAELLENNQGTHKLFVGAAATIIGGLLSTIIVLVVAFM